jgi:hypothetical protein
MLYRAEKSCDARHSGQLGRLLGWGAGQTYHDAKAQTQRACEENITFLNAKVALPREEANNGVDADDSGAEDACCSQSDLRCRGAQRKTLTNTADDAHDPSSRIIVEVSS